MRRYISLYQLHMYWLYTIGIATRADNLFVEVLYLNSHKTTCKFCVKRIGIYYIRITMLSVSTTAWNFFCILCNVCKP